MDFELYTQISQYLHATLKERRKIPPGLARNKRTAFCLRAKKYSLVDGYLRRDGKIVLHKLNVTPVLRNLHRSTLSHRGNSNDLHQEARSQYFIEGDLRDVCRNVCFEGIKCIEARMILSDEVPMRHLSSKTRERICRTIMTPVKKAKGNRSHKPRVPVFVAGKEPIATQDCDSANVNTHEPITIEGACTLSSCLLDCLHYLITGRKVQSYRLQRTLEDQQLRERGRLDSFYYPFHDPNATLLSRGVIDSDMHLLAEMLGVHIYEYRTDLSPPKWNYVAGNKHGQNGSEAIYLQYWQQHEGPHKGEGHVAIITGMHPKPT